MHIFYTPDLIGDFYTLNEEESRHCHRVLRLNTGDHVHLIDGKGGLYEAEITAVSKRHVDLKVVSRQMEFGKRNHHLHIAIAPTKNIDRLEWFLEKATEMGIDEVSLLQCERSERKAVNEERLFKVVTSAVKQSLTAYHPVLHPLQRFSDFMGQSLAEGTQCFIAHCMDGAKKYLSETMVRQGRYIILIGPEGDFSPKELEEALQCGYKPVTLGATRLRTETAALAACLEVNIMNR